MGVGAQAPQRVNLSDPLDDATARGSIPGTLRRKIRNAAGDTCHYCGSFGSVYDHVVPVDQGGLSVDKNLVFACHRCNAQKLNRTPGQWKQWRLNKGLCWPPVDVAAAFIDLCSGIPERFAAELEPHHGDAMRSAFPPLMALLDRVGDDLYAETPWPPEEWLTAVRPIIDQYIAHVLPDEVTEVD